MPLADDVEEISILDLEPEESPYPMIHRLQREDPVHWDPGIQAWFLARYEDVKSVLRDYDRFTNNRWNVEASEGWEDLQRTYRTTQDALAYTDPPQHGRIRGALSAEFRPATVEEELGEYVRETSRELLDEAIDDEGRLELIEPYAARLPLHVIGRMFGVPEGDLPRLRRWTDVFMDDVLSTEDLESHAGAADAIEEVESYFRERLDERREDPRDDLLSTVAGAEAEGELTEQEALSTCVSFFAAGHPTTTGLIGNGVWTLINHPDQFRKLKRNPELIEPAVEELLRFENSAVGAPRIAREDVEIGGTLVAEGDRVLPCFIAANRDPEVFDEPDRFDVTREPNDAIPFGHSIHFCIGAPLARLEIRTALAQLVDRAETLQLGERGLTWKVHPLKRGFKQLQVRLR